MNRSPEPTLTQLLSALCVETRDPASEQAAYDALYPHLHAIAAKLMRRESSSHTLQPTALVNEAYLRLVDQQVETWRSRAHFFAIAARIMRRVLVDHARTRARIKRGGAFERVTLHDVSEMGLPGSESHVLELITFDRALCALEADHARMAHVVELRVFGGLSVVEVAETLRISERTVSGDWTFACLWLTRFLGGASESPRDV